MSGARKRNKKAPSSENSEKQKTVKKSKASNEFSKQSTSFISICFYGLVFVTGLIGAVAFTGYCRAPFEALPNTDYVREVKLEGKFGLNQKLAKGSR